MTILLLGPRRTASVTESLLIKLLSLVLLPLLNPRITVVIHRAAQPMGTSSCRALSVTIPVNSSPSHHSTFSHIKRLLLNIHSCPSRTAPPANIPKPDSFAC